MSNKPWTELNELDRVLRRATPVGIRDAIDVTIRKVTGFELFNTRPNHNDEKWSDGYEVDGQGVTAKAEDLDDAIELWVERLEEKLDRIDEASEDAV